jgi:hypothetical protein
MFQPFGVPTPPNFHIPNTWKDSPSAIPSSFEDLLPHYESTTSLTIGNGSQEKYVWQSQIPQIAAEHQFLVKCVLSISSLHFGHLYEVKDQPEQSRYWNAVAASQMNQALFDYRLEINSVTPRNVAALFASSALTAVYLFRSSVMDFKSLRAAISSHNSYSSEVAGKMLSCVVGTMWGLRGPLEILTEGWRWLINGEIQSVASRKWWPKTREPANSYARDEDERLRRIENFWVQTDRQYDPRSNHLSQALSLLRESYALVSQLLSLKVSKVSQGVEVLDDRGAIFSWVTRVPQEYIRLVEARDRDALVILAHYAVLLKRMETVWWVEGLDSNFVIAIAMALGSEHQKLIKWPAHLVGVAIDA